MTESDVQWQVTVTSVLNFVSMTSSYLTFVYIILSVRLYIGLMAVFK
jgi:hypothetical protein